MSKLFYKTFPVIFGILCSNLFYAQQNLKLTYDKPGTNWNEALPIGNGKLGAMIFGGVSQEHLQLNEETIWAGEPGNNVPKNTFDSIQKVRRLLNEGQFEKAQD
ncbi:MAG: glycoside hydrolase family 95 protein, partial [Chryseobacterium sp.]